MDYVEVNCIQNKGTEHNEILIAYLAAIGYSMFEETDNGVKAYIEQHAFSRELLDDLLASDSMSNIDAELQINNIPAVNWNATWESNFKPVLIKNKIFVRAEYHESNTKVDFELIIQPRMAFGTGHHATTSLVMEAMLDIDFVNKSVLDMGCGTGILAVLASKMGASPILAVDIDPNSTENTEMNMQVNKTPDIEVITGGAKVVGERKFDIILANINRNIILEDLSLYVHNLNSSGMLITSGYYEQDLAVIQDAAQQFQLKLHVKLIKDKWCCAIFKY